MAIVDFHAHLYPCFDLDQTFSHFHRNAARCFSNRTNEDHMLSLVERSGENLFEKLSNGSHALPDGWNPTIVEPGLSIKVTKGSTELILIAGRQVVVREGFEILILAHNYPAEDGVAASTLIREVIEEGGIPVLAWAPGKWMFSRARSVHALLEEFDPGSLAIGDTTLRPACSTGGPLFQKARERGYLILPGSDPLPRKQEQTMAGRYCGQLALDRDAPAASLQSFFRSENRVLNCAPCRSSLLTTARRIFMHEVAKRQKKRG